MELSQRRRSYARFLPVLVAAAAAIAVSLPAHPAGAAPLGSAADWTQATPLARRTQLILAGGLTPHNVAGAIAAVQPFGVDVSSGVESTPGQKDPRKIIEFIQAARAAFAGVTHEAN